MWDVLLTECHLATLSPGASGFGVIREGALAVAKGRIAWLGAASNLPHKDARKVACVNGAWVTPGLIDCHTHLVFAGNRAEEWSLRAKGASYEEIARAGGGILSTVSATREASEDELVRSATARARVMAHQGVTTIEIKSGYGLDLKNELKTLRAAARVGPLAKVDVVCTCLGAHVVPPEFRDDRAAYVDFLCNTLVPIVAREKAATAVDAFCETIAFTREETDRIFAAARACGLNVRIHAEQLSDAGGAVLAAKHGALSADHLEYLGADGIAAMAQAGTVAVVLPGAFYFLKETKKPPIEALRRAAVPIAVATDCNPGTSPMVSPLLALNMACTFFGLSPEEALRGMTACAARALGLERETGTLEAGKRADLAVWNITEPSELCYWIGADLLSDRYLAGQSVQD